MDVRPLADADRDHARAWIRAHWGDESMAAHGELFFPADHEGFIAGEWEGLVTYRVADNDCEITLIETDPPGVGTGGALLAAVVEAARNAGCRRVWLVSTNDNVDALRWYEHRGFVVEAVRERAIDRWRATLKPTIPTHHPTNGLPIRDEIELSLAL